jgi:hypothetical protein
MAVPVAVSQSRILVSPTCAVIKVEEEAGCQNGIGVGVDMSATLQVLPPKNRFGPPILLLKRDGLPRISSALIARSALTESSSLLTCAATKS